MHEFDKLWDYGDPKETEQRFRALLQDGELSHDRDYLAQLLTQIARTEGLQGHFDRAHATLDEVETLINEHGLPVAHVRYLLERGRAFNSSHQQEKALPLFLQAFELAEAQSQHRYAVDALHMVAIAERDPHAQLEWNLKAIALAESANEKGWLFALYNNIGESYLALGHYDLAHDIFDRLAALQTERFGKPDMYTVKDLAKSARLAGRPNESANLMLPILEKLVSANGDDGYIQQEYAEALHASGRISEAKPHFAAAYTLLAQDSWVLEYEADKLARMKEMSA